MANYKNYFLLSLLLLGLSLRSQNTVGTILNTSEAFNGYTLLTPNSNELPNYTYLINNCGQIVNQWESTFKGQGADVLLPSGDLYRGAFDDNSTLEYAGNNGRLERYDWEGNLTWSLTYSEEDFSFHHDYSILENGNILLIVAKRKGSAEAIAAGRNPNTLSQNDLYTESIVEIQPEGSDSFSIIWEWDFWDHLIQDFDASKANFGVVSDHPEKLDINYIGLSNEKADWIHLNSIDYNQELDHIIISARFTSEFYIIDHSTTTAEAGSDTGGNSGKGGSFLYRWGNPLAYQRGTQADQQLFGQHNVHWTKATETNFGKILVFNNGFTRGFSNILLIDPPSTDQNGNYPIASSEPYLPLQGQVLYETNPPENFYAPFLSSAFELENGNLLINNGPIGNTFEINSLGEKVWDYLSPVTVSNGTLSQGDEPPGINARFFRTRKYSVNSEAFEGRDLSPIGYLENNPIPENDSCATLSLDNQPNILPRLVISPNPTSGTTIINNSPINSTFQVYNIHGQLVLTNSNNQINLTDFKSGVYFVRISSPQLTETIKVLKK